MQKYFHSKNMANVKITTGQFVSVEQQVSSVIERIYAQMLDYVFISFYFGIVMVAVMLSLSASYNDNIITAIFIVLILPVIFYHPIFEFILNGIRKGPKEPSLIRELDLVKQALHNGQIPWRIP